MTNRERLFQILRDVSYEEREVVLASGRRSSFYIDARNTALHPEGNVLCGHLLFRLLRADGPEFQAVAGPSIGADPLVAAVAAESFRYSSGDPVPGLMVRKEPKGYGTGQLVEGMKNVRPGARVALIEDVLTTGGSTLRTAEALHQAGLVPVRVVVLVDREEGGRAAVESTGLHVSALFTRSDFESCLPTNRESERR